ILYLCTDPTTTDLYTLSLHDALPISNSNHFIYKENVLAAYASYKSPISDKLDFQLGLRAEYSDITGNSVTSNQVNKQDYLDLFRSEEHTSELQSRENLVCRLLLEKKK